MSLKTLDEECRQEKRFLEFKQEEAKERSPASIAMLSVNMYHARTFLFQLVTSQQIVSTSNQSFRTNVFSRQQFLLT